MKEMRLETISVRYGAVQALHGVDINLSAGNVLLMAGPNGAGKSTLIQVLLGLVKPDTGRILIDGRTQRIDNAYKRRVGYLPEAVAFGANLSGREVLRFFCAAKGGDKGRIDGVLARVGLEEAGKRAVKGYSRGMRQRLGLGVAMLADPDLLLLDEPTGGLDQEGISLLASLISEWRTAGKLVLISSHDLTLFERKVDHVCLLRRGEVLAMDTPAGLRGSASWLPVRVTLQMGGSGDEWKQLMREVSELSGDVRVSGNGDALVVDVAPGTLRSLLNVQARYNGAVRDIRIEEPGLDMVYEALLEKEVPLCSQ